MLPLSNDEKALKLINGAISGQWDLS
jgi:hypothetical protein